MDRRSGLAQRYAVKADIEQFAIASQDKLPGATNLSGSVDLSEQGGELRVASEKTSVALPRLYADPLGLDHLKGDVRWRHVDGALLVQWQEVAFDNADAAGTTAGSWRSHPDGPGEIDATAQLTRANLASTHRYIPLTVAPAVRGWLRRALVKGTSGDARLVLAGISPASLLQTPTAAGSRSPCMRAMERWTMRSAGRRCRTSSPTCGWTARGSPSTLRARA